MVQNLENKKVVMIVAPFWGKLGHVGNYRIDRFIRWLKAEKFRIVLIKAASEENIKEMDWGLEISIKDSIGKVSEVLSKFSQKIETKLFLYVWYLIIQLFIPVDSYFVWAKSIHNSKLLKNYISDVKFILSSSPPHSGLVAAYNISKKYSIPTIIDMRDGWIDEPMQPGLIKWSLRRIIEIKLEKKILEQAIKIFVTSDVWKKLLVNRLPFTAKKTTVITNAYPIDYENYRESQNRNTMPQLILLHAGRFRGSRRTNNVSILLQPLYKILKKKKNLELSIVLLGDLNREDYNELTYWRQQFSTTLCQVITKNRVKRKEMYTELAQANGLLLLATANAFIPSKTFEYIKSAKPILAVTLKNSSVWQMSLKIPQMFLFDYSAEEKDYSSIAKFLLACSTGKYEYNVPEEYSEEYLSKVFINAVNKIL